MKLLILVQWYPPDIRVPARRWGNIVSSLQKKGVICTVVSAGDGKHDEYTGKYGERVIRLGISNQKRDAEPKRDAFKRSFPSRLRRKLNAKLLPPVFQNSSYNEWFKQKDTYPELIDIARNSDYIISSYGPLGPFVFGWWLSKKTNRPWIADIRDSFESKETEKISAWKRIQNRITEKYLLKRAELRITIGATLADYLSEQYRVVFHAIYNGWVDEDRIINFSHATDNQRYIYYAGSIYEHRLPALEVIMEALKQYPNIKLKLRLVNDNTSGKMFLLINGAENSNQVEVLPPVRPEIVNKELAGSLCAIVIEEIFDADPLRNCTVTGKLISLLASGVPGIAVSSKSGEIRHLAGKIDGWYGVDSVDKFRDALKEIIRHGNSIKNTDNLTEYKMEKQSQKLLTLISEIKN